MGRLRKLLIDTLLAMSAAFMLFMVSGGSAQASSFGAGSTQQSGTQGNYSGMSLTFKGQGFRVYLCQDVAQLAPGGQIQGYSSLAGALDSIAASSPRCFVLFNGAVSSAVRWDYASNSKVTISASGGFRMPDGSSFQFQDGVGATTFTSTKYANGSGAGYLNIKCAPLGEVANFQSFASSVFGAGYADYSKAVVIFEPFMLMHSSATGEDIAFTWAGTYHSAKMSGGATGVAGTGQLSFLNTDTGFSGVIGSHVNMTTGYLANYGGLRQVMLLNVAQNIQPKSDRSGFVAYGPGAGNVLSGAAVAPAVADADFVLQEWELNHVYDTILGASTLLGSGTAVKVNGNQFTVDPAELNGTAFDCGTAYTGELVSDAESYSVKISEKSAYGDVVGADNASPGKYLWKVGHATWSRPELRTGQVVDTSGGGGQVIDYGLNLIRPWFNDYNGVADKRVVSQMTPAGNSGYLSGTLRLTFGLKPASAPAQVPYMSTARMLLDKKLSDTFSFGGVYDVTGGTVHYCAEDRTINCAQNHDSSTGHMDWVSCPQSEATRTTTDPATGATYYWKQGWVSGDPGWNHEKTIRAAKTGCHVFEPLLVSGSARSEFTFTMTCQAYKYMVAPYDASTPPVGVADRRVTDDANGGDYNKEFKFCQVSDPGIILKFYPEVTMTYYTSDGGRHEVETIGEELRTAYAPMLLMYRIKGNDGLKGVVSSDTAVGGAASQNTGNVVALTAGGDFTVKAESQATLSLYGYCLDVLEPGECGWTQNIKGAWGDAGKSTIKAAFVSWASGMVSPRSYQADLRMRIGTNKYVNFSATVGRFSKGVSSPTESVFPIKVENGAVVNDVGYQSLLSALQADYGESGISGQQIFDGAGFGDAVLSAIESSNGSMNGSSSNYYGGSHWYDEAVRYLCVRRYAVDDIRFGNIIAQDKLDLGSAANESLTYANKAGAFDCTIYFDGTDIGGYTMSTVYNASNMADAVAAGNVIFSNVHIKNADFKVTQSTTSSGGR